MRMLKDLNLLTYDYKWLPPIKDNNHNIYIYFKSRITMCANLKILLFNL